MWLWHPPCPIARLRARNDSLHINTEEVWRISSAEKNKFGEGMGFSAFSVCGRVTLISRPWQPSFPQETLPPEAYWCGIILSRCHLLLNDRLLWGNLHVNVASSPKQLFCFSIICLHSRPYTVTCPLLKSTTFLCVTFSLCCRVVRLATLLTFKHLDGSLQSASIASVL